MYIHYSKKKYILYKVCIQLTNLVFTLTLKFKLWIHSFYLLIVKNFVFRLKIFFHTYININIYNNCLLMRRYLFNIIK